MKYDFTIKRILQEIKEDFQSKGIELTEQEIFIMCDTQFKALRFAIDKGIDIRLPIFGTFIRKRSQDVMKGVKEMKALENVLSSNEYSKAILEAKLRRIKEEATRKEKQKTVQTLDELGVLKDFKHSFKAYQKILKND